MILMRNILLLCLLLTGLAASAQRISYDPPTNIPQKIGPADYKHIVDSSVAILNTRYKVAKVKGGSIIVTIGKDSGTVNLDNLVLKCLAEEDRGVWDKLIRDHFS